MNKPGLTCGVMACSNEDAKPERVLEKIDEPRPIPRPVSIRLCSDHRAQLEAGTELKTTRQSIILPNR